MRIGTSGLLKQGLIELKIAGSKLGLRAAS
jgi:hypothetical protein